MLSDLLKSLLRRVSQQARARRTEKLLAQGLRRQEMGDHGGACREYERVLERDPGHMEAHYLLGVAHARCERYGAAEEHLLEAVNLRPDFANARIDLGNVYRLENNVIAAETSYRKALALAPDATLAHFNLALVLKESGKREEALDHFRRAHDLERSRTEVLREYVTCLLEGKLYDEAIAVAETSTNELPDSYDARVCLGLAYQKSHRIEDALECYDRAMSQRSDSADLWNNRGIALQESGRLEAALASYGRALELRPDFTLARFHRGLAYLMAGDYARGWPDYEIRLFDLDRPKRPVSFPRWKGTPLAGCTLLVHGDQGLGDEIMFASCLPEIVREAGHCLIECAPKLQPLFARSFPAATVYAWAPGQPMPAVDRLCDVAQEVPVSSLPLYRRHFRSDFPAHKGYLAADPFRVEHWRARLSGLGAGLKIGISWRGGTFETRSPRRSIALEQWLPILRTSGARFVSLQYTAGAAAELAECRERHDVEIVHWPEAIEDYDETAALVTALDLTISVCTAVIHLSGALGRPVWVMTPFSPEWRYGIAGNTMPWYPLVCLFRQPAPGEWEPVVGCVATRLAELVSRHEAG